MNQIIVNGTNILVTTRNFVKLYDLFYGYDNLLDEFCQDIAVSFGDASHTLISKETLGQILDGFGIEDTHDVYQRFNALPAGIYIDLEN